MDAIQDLFAGFAVAFSLVNLAYVVGGVVVGTIVGALPGFGPATAIAMLLPLTFGLEPETAVILLAGIYYGSMYGGRIPAILLNMPGDAPSVVTTFDGYPMAKQGRAGQALTIAAVASFIGGTVGILALTFLAPPLASLALRFGPPEIAMLTFLGVLLIAHLGGGSLVKGLIAAGAGFYLASVGQDPMLGTERLTLGSNQLLGGISFIPIVMGVFGLGEVLYNLEHRRRSAGGETAVSKIWPSIREWTTVRFAMLRGSIVGLLIGMVPGAGAEIASMSAYALEKRRSKHPERFGNGAAEGVASPEAANNAGAVGAFIPLLTLGIPGSVTTALIFGALLMQGITPGPNLVADHPSVFYGLIASMYIGNVLLLFLNIPLIGVFVSILRVRFNILAALVVVILMVGAYSVNNTFFDVWVMLAFGVVGFLARKTGFNMGPFVLAYVLSPIMEKAFRQSLLLSDGSFSIFVTRPVSVSVVLIGILVFGILPAWSSWKKKRSLA